MQLETLLLYHLSSQQRGEWRVARPVTIHQGWRSIRRLLVHTSGDWGTPSEYIRELIRQDKERRMANLERELLAAAKGPKIEVSISEIRKKGLITALRERARRA